MTKIQLGEKATFKNFNERGYLLANLDVQKAVTEKAYKDGLEHFKIFGHKENRIIYSMDNLKQIEDIRKIKQEKLADHFRTDISFEITNQKHNFLTGKLRQIYNIISTDNVSANSYDQHIIDIINMYPDGMILDCGAGLRENYYSNVYNYEIADYITTDILGVGEVLPFADETFDAVISIAVLEHVKDPFLCASEIVRVLKRGGTLISCIPFLQPYHGYPHHYYNMTHQGHENLYEKEIDIKSVQVFDSTSPIYSLTWFLQKYQNGLNNDHARERFLNMKIRDFMDTPESFLKDEIVTSLSETAKKELASATILIGQKSK